MTKKNILLVSLANIILIYILANPVFFRICIDTYTFGSHTGCSDKFQEIIAFGLMPFIPVLLFSLITYRMNDSIFLAWRSFSYWFIPLTIFLVLITPEGNSVIMSWGKEVPAIGMSALYFLISTIIIIGTWRKTRNTTKVSG